MEGKIVSIVARTEKRKLSVTAQVECEGRKIVDASLPGREKAALIPRSILIGEAKQADEAKLTEIQEILNRLTVGRKVRIWEYQETMYCAFLQWADVTFHIAEDDASSAA